MKCLLVCAFLVLTASPAIANEGQDSLEVVLQQQRELQADLDDGGVEGLTTRQNNAIRKAQKEVFEVTEGKTKLDELSVEEKIRLENALERINAEVVNTRTASNNQNVCWRERVSGSGMKKTRCGTAAEMREAREGARDYLERSRACPDCGTYD
ncbi:MAG TPA: hypothetical protein VGD21_00310 [Lysobacter sp.]